MWTNDAHEDKNRFGNKRVKLVEDDLDKEDSCDASHSRISTYADHLLISDEDPELIINKHKEKFHIRNAELDLNAYLCLQ